MAKRKRSKKTISERAKREAENNPVVRELRRRAASIEAELSGRRRSAS